MPANYPPIAPRGPNARPTASTTPAQSTDLRNLDALPDEAGYRSALAALQADRRRYLEAAHPVKDALNIALQQPAGVLLARYAKVIRAIQDAQNAALESDEPGERQAGTAADVDDRPAIVAFTETMVAKAIMGDSAAMAMVADRVEGKPGLRRADETAETIAARERTRLIVGELVRDMVERRLPGDSARVVDATLADDET
jgi:hypothetical protein